MSNLHVIIGRKYLGIGLGMSFIMALFAGTPGTISDTTSGPVQTIGHYRENPPKMLPVY